jgi:hypothetical protein
MLKQLTFQLIAIERSIPTSGTAIAFGENMPEQGS